MQSKLPDIAFDYQDFLIFERKKRERSKSNFIGVVVPYSQGWAWGNQIPGCQLQTPSSTVYSLPNPLQGSV